MKAEVVDTFVDTLQIGAGQDDRDTTERFVALAFGPVRLFMSPAEARGVAETIVTAAEHAEHPSPDELARRVPMDDQDAVNALAARWQRRD